MKLHQIGMVGHPYVLRTMQGWNRCKTRRNGQTKREFVKDNGSEEQDRDSSSDESSSSSTSDSRSRSSVKFRSRRSRTKSRSRNSSSSRSRSRSSSSMSRSRLNTRSRSRGSSKDPTIVNRSESTSNSSSDESVRSKRISTPVSRQKSTSNSSSESDDSDHRVLTSLNTSKESNTSKQVSLSNKSESSRESTPTDSDISVKNEPEKTHKEKSDSESMNHAAKEKKDKDSDNEPEIGNSPTKELDEHTISTESTKTIYDHLEPETEIFSPSLLAGPSAPVPDQKDRTAGKPKFRNEVEVTPTKTQRARLSSVDTVDYDADSVTVGPSVVNSLKKESDLEVKTDSLDKIDSKALRREASKLKRQILMSSSSEDSSDETVRSIPESESDADSEYSDSCSTLSSNESSDDDGVRKEVKTSAKKGNKSQKRIRSLHGIDHELRELKILQRLTNLKTLERKKCLFPSGASDDDLSEVRPLRNRVRKEKEKPETLLDFMDKSDDSDVEVETSEAPGNERAEYVKFWTLVNGMLKEELMTPSDADDASESSQEVPPPVKGKEKVKKKTRKKSEDGDSDVGGQWRKDRLLRDAILSSSEEEELWLAGRELGEDEKSKKVSDDDVIPIENGKMKKKRKRTREAVSTDSDTESEVEHILSQKSQDTPSKGRKNIKKILKKDSLKLETKQAIKAENERKKRIKERQKAYEKFFPNALEEKRLILDFDLNTGEELLTVDRKLAAKLKTHQFNGVKFMWDCSFESLKRLEEDSGSGCILAHCMGLGKTLQVVTLVHTLLKKNTGVSSVLIVCPLGTIINWTNEFEMWLKDIRDGEIDVRHLNAQMKPFQKALALNSWIQKGGVCIISYPMFRTMTTLKNAEKVPKHWNTFRKTLLDPGPDVIICDEGHQLKSNDSELVKCIHKVKTSRRIVLTGTPLQNNLMEYYFMVQFIKPNLLGTKKEFTNRFVNPIKNGQYKDSTPKDVRLMKRRSHVLHSMLDSCLQRLGYQILKPYLPEKMEYVIKISLTETQANLYRLYLDNYSGGSEIAKPSANTKTAKKRMHRKLFYDFHRLHAIYTHPKMLVAKMEKILKQQEKEKLKTSLVQNGVVNYAADEIFLAEDDVLDGEGIDVEMDESTTESTVNAKAVAGTSFNYSMPGMAFNAAEQPENSKTVAETLFNHSATRTDVNPAAFGPLQPFPAINPDPFAGTFPNPGVNGCLPNKQEPIDWWKDFIPEDEYESINSSNKLLVLFSILSQCKLKGDKLLVFSHSLITFDIIEYFLSKFNQLYMNRDESDPLYEYADSWVAKEDYYRLDGSTKGEDRSRWTKLFNRPENKRARLFLMSTKAGGLGINVIGANRVVLFDASWNPSDDTQSIFRIYRFGQTKTSYVYRFVAEATMEEKKYERQVTKLSLADRVIDEHQPERHFTISEIAELYKFDPAPVSERVTPLVPKDELLANVLQRHKDIVVSYHEHDSLLEKKEEELTAEEREAAWEEYEKERQSEDQRKEDAEANLINRNNAEPPGTDNEDLIRMLDQYGGTLNDLIEDSVDVIDDVQTSPIKIVNVQSLQNSTMSSPVSRIETLFKAMNDV